MNSFLWRFDFVDVSELARDNWCAFDVWFSPALWTWCVQQSPRGPRFRNLSRERAIVVSLSIALQDPDQFFPRLCLVARVGGTMFVNVVRLPDENGERRYAVMFPSERHGRFIGD